MAPFEAEYLLCVVGVDQEERVIAEILNFHRVSISEKGEIAPAEL